VYGDLLSGWIATSLICSALDWRTHVWVTGNSGSGKSTVINNIVSACVGEMALYPLGETTESGIRQRIGSDGRPIIFDEMEGTDERGPAGANRRNAIIQLMRMASTEGKGRILKGSAGHQAVAFTMKSSFLVASIGMSLKEAPDLTRTMVLGLKPLMVDARPEERKDAEEQWVVMNKLSARISSDMPSRLFVRMSSMVPTVLSNVKTFCEAIATRLGNRRLGDQIGTLLAGRFALTTKKVLTMRECLEYIDRYSWEGVAATPAEREDLALLGHLRQHILRVQGRAGHTVERSIGEMVRHVLGFEHDSTVEIEEADGALNRIGIKVDAKGGSVYIARRFAALDRIMATSTNPTDWVSVISRHPKALPSQPTIRFASSAARALVMPADVWME
jgi:putative DNA primase/helicase